jgi:NodT family efflux transporter outer membrane factor (OMF) lipoprotein
MKEFVMTSPASRLILSLVASTALCGCMVGPKYHRPSAPTPTEFKELEGWKHAEPSDAIDRGPWWTLFNDPVLNQLEEKVVVSNQNIAAAEAAYREAHAVVAENRAALFPTVDLTASATTTGGGSSGGGAHGSSSSNRVYQAGIGSTWAPDLWGKVRRQIEGARSQAQASAADLANVRLSAQTELASDYLQLRADDEEIRLLDKTAQDYATALKVSQNKYAAGVAAKSDVLSAQTQMLNAQSSAEATKQARQTLEHAIAMLTGVPPAELTIAPQPFNPTVPDVPATAPSTLLERRPDVAAAERLASAANAQIGVQIAAYYPNINLSASFGFNRTDLANLFSSGVWTLAASAGETLFNGGLRHAQVAQARAAYDQSVANYRQTVLTAFQQVEDALAAEHYLASQADLDAKSSQGADETEQIVLNQYRAGTAAQTDVIVAENTALSARITLINAQRNRLVAVVSLVEALGGGWSTAELPKRP